MALDLQKIGSVVEQYMTDSILIVRRSEDEAATIDPVTLELELGEARVYSGKCFIAPMGSPNEAKVGELPTARMWFEVAIPYSSNVTVKPQDTVRVQRSNDAALKGRELVITGVIPTTFNTHRRIAAYMDDASA